MELGDCRLNTPYSPLMPVSQLPAESDEAPGTSATLLNALDRESLLLNVDASLRVYARHHFFSWTQGMLQNLVRHEALICALRNGAPAAFYVDSFAAPRIESSLISTLFREDASMVPYMIKTWEENRFSPVICDVGSEQALSGSALGRELKRVGAPLIVAHGTYDVFGRPVSLFVFACQSEALDPRRVFLLELMVPFLHLAWVRTQINMPAGQDGATRPAADLLTARQREILRWIHLGKSNLEIGIILNISSLTVKNHVQKILRKLKVQNRTHAVAKALAMRILNT